MTFFSNIRLLILSIWLGAGVFFIAAAQVAFSVLPDRELAGAVVGRNLSLINISGMVIAITLLLTTFVGVAGVSRLWLWTERVMLFLLGAACVAGQFVIGLWLSSVRFQMGRPIDEVPADDPLRLQFNALHDYSTWVFMAAMIAALIAFFIIANRRFTVVKDVKPDVYDFSKEFKT